MRHDLISFSTRTSIRLCLQCSTHEIVYSAFSFWLPLIVNACLHPFINFQLASWLILRIASLPNTSCDGVCCVVVCTIDRVANILDERIPSKGFSLSKSICWIWKVHMILPIVWCSLSTIALACGWINKIFRSHLPSWF